MIRTVSVWASSALALVGVSCAQVGTIDDAFRAAFAGNDTLEAERFGLEALRSEVGIARTNFLPSLTVEGTVQRTEIDIENTGYTGGVRLTQPLYNGGRGKASMKAARANIRAGEAALKLTENEIFTGVIEAYAELIFSREVVILNRKLVVGLEAQLDAERRRLRAGDRTRTDVDLTEARLASAVAQLAEARGSLRRAEQEFFRLIGDRPAEELAPIQLDIALPTNLDEALIIARNENPLINQLRHSATVADADVAIRRSALRPRLSAEARLQYRDQVFEFTGVEIEQTLGTVGATLQIPLYQGGGAWSQLTRAKKIRKLRQFEITEGIREVESAVVTAWGDYRATKFKFAATERAVRASREALVGVKTEADYGTRSTIDILDTERDLHLAEIDHAETAKDLDVAQAILLSSIGRLSSETLPTSLE